MVQVDVFWTYGIGATCAVAASRQLVREAAEPTLPSWSNSPYFTKMLLFLSLLFVPSGVCLLWAFPSWETMHAGDRNLPAWLVTGFVATNISQGIVGYWVARLLILKKRIYAAFLSGQAAYLAMFFILVHGWDGKGYQRFFSASKEDFLHWSSANVAQWFQSDVAITLALFGIPVVPLLLHWYSDWIAKGVQLAGNPAQRASKPLLIALLLGALFTTLAVAIAASVLVHNLGWLAGLIATALLLTLVSMGRWSPMHWLYRNLFLMEGNR